MDEEEDGGEDEEGVGGGGQERRGQVEPRARTGSGRRGSERREACRVVGEVVEAENQQIFVWVHIVTNMGNYGESIATLFFFTVSQFDLLNLSVIYTATDSL